MSKWGEYLIGRAEEWGAEEWAQDVLAESLETRGISAVVPAVHLLGRQLAESELHVRPNGTLYNALNLSAGVFNLKEYGQMDGDGARCIVTLPLRFAGSDYSVGNFQSRHDMGYSPVCSRVYRLDEPDWLAEVSYTHSSGDECKCDVFAVPGVVKDAMPSGLAMLAGADVPSHSLLLDFGRAIGEIALEEGISKVINSVGEIDEALNELKSYYASNMLAFEE